MTAAIKLLAASTLKGPQAGGKTLALKVCAVVATRLMGSKLSCAGGRPLVAPQKELPTPKAKPLPSWRALASVVMVWAVKLVPLAVVSRQTVLTVRAPTRIWVLVP